MERCADSGPDEGEAMSEHDEREDYDDALEWGPIAPAHTGRGAASVMWMFGLMQLIGTQFWVAFVVTVLVVVHFVDEDMTLVDAWRTVTNFEIYWLTFLGWPIATTCAILVMRGANGLRRFRHYPFAVTAAVLSILSVPFVCLAVAQTIVGIYGALPALASRRPRSLRGRGSREARHFRQQGERSGVSRPMLPSSGGSRRSARHSALPLVPRARTRFTKDSVVHSQ